MLENTWVLALTIYGAIIVLGAWIAMVVWAYRDMRARTRDGIGQLFVAVMVGVLFIPGLLIYLLIRPRETLSEAYERSLEEEALLQEIEEKPTCPGCGQRVHDEWQACPHCHTRLKKPCYHCNNLLDLNWELCPYCAHEQSQYRQQMNTVQYAQQYQPEPPPNIDDKWLANPQQKRKADYPQYVDDEY